MKFSDKAVTKLDPPADASGTLPADWIAWDDDLPGFGVRLRTGPGGTKRFWVVQWRFQTKQRRESLGDVRKVSLEDARKAARQRFAKLELGVDPAAEREQAHAQASAGKLTLAVAVDRYLEIKKVTLRPSTFRAAEQYFAVHWKPLRSKPLDSIKLADVAARLQEIVKEHGRTSAARARGNLSVLFSWAMREGLCESNPVANTNDPAEGIESRDRVLDDDEIRTIWKSCRDEDFGRIVKLLLLTGCRREEIAGLRWSEVNLDSGVMTILGTRTKNKRTLTLTLPAPALEILQAAPRRDGRDYVFGFSGGGFSAFSYSSMALNSRIIEAEGKPMAPWRLHDLRRTMRTGLGKLGTPPHIAELAINHVRGGIQAVYDRHNYQGEIKVALGRWADHVAVIVAGGGSNVVTLRAGA